MLTSGLGKEEGGMKMQIPGCVPVRSSKLVINNESTVILPVSRSPDLSVRPFSTGIKVLFYKIGEFELKSGVFYCNVTSSAHKDNPPIKIESICRER